MSIKQSARKLSPKRYSPGNLATEDTYLQIPPYVNEELNEPEDFRKQEIAFTHCHWDERTDANE